MVTAIKGQRIESPERWAKALQRATAAGIDVLDIAGDPQRFAVESQSRPGVVHLVDAAKGESAMADTVECATCRGRGWSYIEVDGGRTFPERIACHRCAGSGQMPVRLHVLAPKAVHLAAD